MTFEICTLPPLHLNYHFHTLMVPNICVSNVLAKYSNTHVIISINAKQHPMHDMGKQHIPSSTGSYDWQQILLTL